MSDTIVSIAYALLVGGILLFIIMRYLAHKRVQGGGGAKAALVQRQKSLSRNAKHISDSLGLKSDDIVTISHDMGFNERDFENSDEESILRGKLSAMCRDFLLEHRILFHATSAGKTAIIRQLNSTLHLDVDEDFLGTIAKFVRTTRLLAAASCQEDGLIVKTSRLSTLLPPALES